MTASSVKPNTYEFYWPGSDSFRHFGIAKAYCSPSKEKHWVIDGKTVVVCQFEDSTVWITRPVPFNYEKFLGPFDSIEAALCAVALLKTE